MNKEDEHFMRNMFGISAGMGCLVMLANLAWFTVCVLIVAAIIRHFIMA